MKKLKTFEGYNGNYWKIELHDAVASSLRNYTVKSQRELDNITQRVLNRIGKKNTTKEEFSDATYIVSSLINDDIDSWKDELEYYVNKISKDKKLNVEDIAIQALNNLTDDGFDVLDIISYEEFVDEVEKTIMKKTTDKYNL